MRIGGGGGGEEGLLSQGWLTGHLSLLQKLLEGIYKWIGEYTIIVYIK